MNILVFLDNSITNNILNLQLVKAIQKLKNHNTQIHVIIIDDISDTEKSNMIQELNIDKLYIATIPSNIKENRFVYKNTCIKTLESFIQTNNYNLIINNDSLLSKEIFAILALKLNIPIYSDIIDICIKEQNLCIKKPLYGGKIYANIMLSTSELKILNIRPNSFFNNNSTTITNNSISIENIPPVFKTNISTNIHLLNKTTNDDTEDLTNAKVVVAGGRGVNGVEGFELLKKLAHKLKGATGASRAAVDAGYAPYSMQIGQTGKTVNPLVYIACGISGSIQHLAGMQTSQTIIAINNNAEAPIFKIADYGIIDDLNLILPSFISMLENE